MSDSLSLSYHLKKEGLKGICIWSWKQDKTLYHLGSRYSSLKRVVNLILAYLIALNYASGTCL